MIESFKVRVLSLSQLDISVWTIWDWLLILIFVVGAFFVITKLTVYFVLVSVFIIIVLLFSDEKFSFWGG